MAGAPTKVGLKRNSTREIGMPLDAQPTRWATAVPPLFRGGDPREEGAVPRGKRACSARQLADTSSPIASTTADATGKTGDVSIGSDSIEAGASPEETS